ncbi:MAG: stage III sporulation protein AE [Clostridiales bacterium]|nr:stage III sporulation protein AE [Clostridiales bacterium]
MKKIILAIVVISAALFCLCGVGENPNTAENDEATPAATHQTDGASGESVDDLLGKLNLSDVQGVLDTLSSDGLAVFGFGDIAERIRAVASGEFKNDFGSIATYALALLGADIFEFIPMLIGCLAIVLAYNIVNSIKSRAASESVGKVVYFATGTLAVTLVVGYFASVMAYAVKFVASLKTQINAVAPVLITLMTAAGATSSASVYAPSIAVLGSGMTNVVTYLAFPALLMAMVFDIIGSVFGAVKLDKTAEFFRSACKWFLGTAFFLFVTVIGVSGITASVSDGISVRAAKFAMSKYVPIIGGYLSQGFDFVMAGNVLIKNALGSSAIVLIVLFALPVISKLAVFTLTLKLTAAIAEPLGGEKFSGVLTTISKSSSAMNAVVFAMTFLYILFLSMTICTGNMAL